jgi:tRNA/rRNA methyltransferase
MTLDPAALDRIRVILVCTRNPLNIGAVARAMSNFGFAKLRVVNPYEPSFREAKSAVGASHILAAAKEFTLVADAIADCSLVIGTTTGRNRDVSHRILSLEAARDDIRAGLARGAVALMFGSEKRGLSNEDLAHCHWLLRIPTLEEHPSMNLGQAVAVCLYEIARSAASARNAHAAETPMTAGTHADAQPATAAELERITEVLLDGLRASGYVKPRTEAATEDNVRRLIRRLNLHSDDAKLLLGMLRKIGRKLGGDDE